MLLPEQQFYWFLRATYAVAAVDLSVSGMHALQTSWRIPDVSILLAIQVFMCLCMVSLYLEAPPTTRIKRRPYIIASLLILLLSCANAVIEGIYTYNILFQIVPGPESVEAGWDIADPFKNPLFSAGSLLWDISIWVADAVLVRRLTCIMN
jgi:hypothetical protein